jgi:hypothetical protein
MLVLIGLAQRAKTCWSISIAAAFAITIWFSLQELTWPLMPFLLLAFVWTFGEHYKTVCSAAPVDRSTALAFRTSGDLPHSIKPGRLVESLVDAFKTWIVYDSQNSQAAGLQKSLAGSHFRRFTLTVCLLLSLIAYMPAIENVVYILTAKWNIFIKALLYLLILPTLIACVALAGYRKITRSFGLKQHAKLSNYWRVLLEDYERSNNKIEAQSIFHGLVVADGSPILNPVESLEKHLWLVGSTGSGKTTYLMVLLEQLIRRKYSVLCLDLKADSFELLQTMKETALAMPTPPQLKYLTHEKGKATHLFSPFMQSWWSDLSNTQKTDVLLSSMGLAFSRDYGESYFSDVCYHLLDYVIHKYPKISSFCELESKIAYEIRHAKPDELTASMKRDGEHVAMIVSRLAKAEFLNYDNSTSGKATNSALQLEELFNNQGLVYAGLNCLKGQVASPELARIIFGSVLACSTAVQRKQKLVVVIDEFQQMVAPGVLQLALRQARSLGISVILANQTVADLSTRKNNFAATVESNTATQIWFKAGGRDEIAQIQELSGKVISRMYSKSVSNGPNGQSTSISENEVLTERFHAADLALVSSARDRFVIRITDNCGYAQYDGVPFVGRYDYHLSLADYQARTQAGWPTPSSETIVVGSSRSQTNPAPMTPPAKSPSPNNLIGTGAIGSRNATRSKRSPGNSTP